MKKISMIIITLIALFLFCGVANAANNIYSASLEGEISLHISPSEDSFVITKIPACSKLELIKTERTWGLVSFRNKTGWINLSFTRDSYSKAAEATGNDMVSSVQVETKNGQAVLYNVPSEDIVLGSREKYQVPNQTVLEITRQTPSGWGLVSMHGKYAWIKIEDSKPFDTQNESEIYGIYYVYTLSEKGEGVNLFVDEYGKNLCGVIPDCVKLTVRETFEGYGHVSYDGVNGWINLEYTTQSLSNAQSNAGEKVNAEYTVEAPEGETEVSVYSIPSQEVKDGPSIVGTVKKDDSVYVLRSTQGGWSLINCDGQLGWIPPNSVKEKKDTEKYDGVKIYTSEKISYVATELGKGLKVYSEPNGKKEHSFVPETARIKILAEENGYKYVYSDYAAGWVKDVPSFKTYEEALEQYPAERKEIYITKKETPLMTIPVASEFEENKTLMIIPEGKYIEVKRIVTSGKTNWLLVEVDGKCGWINKANAQRNGFLNVLCVAAGIVILLVGASAIIVIHILKKKRKKKAEKEVEEVEESVHDEDSGSREESPALSGK